VCFAKRNKKQIQMGCSKPNIIQMEIKLMGGKKLGGKPKGD
jgi:hypothetical protein